MTDKNEPIDPSTLWTPSNIITMLRICLVPVFVIALLSPWPQWVGIHDLVNNDIKSAIAAIIFIIISCTDWIDGYLARSRNEITTFGKFIDPLADKILVVAALLALIELQVLPSWPVLIIIIREFIVSGLRMLAASKGKVIAASWYGKAKTVTQIVAIVLFLIKDFFKQEYFNSALYDFFYVVSWIVMFVAVILTVLSMIDYISKAWPILSQKSEEDTADDEYIARDIDNLSKEIIALASEKDITIASAESLTGGLICSALTSIAGSSDVVLGGVVSYSNSIKEKILGVDGRFLHEFGAVNSITAEQMVYGLSKLYGADMNVSVTGIAGPGKGGSDFPVGTVFMGCSFGDMTETMELHFDGNREQVRQKTVRFALKKIKEYIE